MRYEGGHLACSFGQQVKWSSCTFKHVKKGSFSCVCRLPVDAGENYCLLCFIDVNVIAIHVFMKVQMGTLFHL